MTHRLFNVSISALLLVSGCSQLIGLGDYEIDPSLDGGAGDAQGGESGSSAGGKGGTGAAGKGGTGAGGDAAGQAGAPSAGQGGDDSPPQGGQPPIAEGGAGGEGGAPPVTIDCDSAECCDEEGGVVVESELIQNGDFEKGRAAWASGYGKHNYPIIVQADDESIAAHSGEWYAWLGGVENDTCYLDSPNFVVPKGTGWLTASGYRLFAFDSMTSTGDVVALALYEAGTVNLAESFAYWDNYEYDTPGEAFVEFSYTVPAAELAEGEYQLSLVGETDLVFDDSPEDPEAQKASNFFFDDLSLKAHRCVAK